MCPATDTKTHTFKNSVLPGMIVHAFKPNTQKAEAGRSLHWFTQACVCVCSVVCGVVCVCMCVVCGVCVCMCVVVCVCVCGVCVCSVVWYVVRSRPHSRRYKMALTLVARSKMCAGVRVSFHYLSPASLVASSG
jgi:hypothetical protein